MSNEFKRVPQTARDLDLTDVWQAIVAGRKTILVFTLGCFIVALAYVMTATPKYLGEAKVLVENQENYLTRQERVDSAPDEAAVASQVQVVMSRDLARQAIRSLKLAGNPEFDPIAGSGGFVRQVAGLVTGSRASTREDRIFEEYYKRLNVAALPKSRVVSVEFESRDPALAARAANTIADLYIEMQANAKRDQARSAGEALGAQVSILRSKVAEAEGKVESFRLQTGLMVGANNTTLPSQQLAEINAQLASARTAQADAQAKARLLREALRSGRLNEVPDIANNELMRRVSEQRVSLRAQLALESRTLGPEHPRTKDLNAQIAAVESEMRGVAEKTARTLENDARIAGSRVDYLTAAVQRQMRAVGTSGDDEVRLRELEREARLLKEQLEQSTQRWQEAVARESSKATPGDARVISRAVEPESPISPKKITALFSLIGGLAASIFGVVAKAMIAGAPGGAAPPTAMPATIQAAKAEECEPALARATPPSPSLAPPVPPAAAQPIPAAAAADVIPPAHESSCDLARRIARSHHGADGLILVVVGDSAPLACEAAIQLGRDLTQSGRALFVDLTPRPASVRAIDGFVDVLEGQSSFGRALRREHQSRLHLMLRGSGRLELGDTLDNALVALARTYDFVLLAFSAQDDIDLALGLASFVDRCVVAKRADAPAHASETIVDALEESGAAAIDVLRVAGDSPAHRRTPVLT